MDKVERVFLVTPLWKFSEQGCVLVSVAAALVRRGLWVALVGPGQETAHHEPEPGVEVLSLRLPEPQAPFSSRLALGLRAPLRALKQRLSPDLVHFAQARWAAFGIPEGSAATGWLADQEGSLCPATPFGLRSSGAGWWGCWRRARKARALQIAALARLAGLAVPDAAIGEAAAKTQLRGMPMVHVLPAPEREPERHAAGLLRLWAEVPF